MSVIIRATHLRVRPWPCRQSKGKVKDDAQAGRNLFRLGVGREEIDGQEVGHRPIGTNGVVVATPMVVQARDGRKKVRTHIKELGKDGDSIWAYNTIAYRLDGQRLLRGIRLR